MSNSEPSAIVLHGIPCIGGLYTRFDSNGENGSLVVRSGFAANVRRDSPFLDRARGLELAWHRRREPGLRDRKESQIACSSAQGADDPAKRRRHPQNSAILVALLAVA